MFRVNCMTYVIIKGVFIHKIMYILCKFNFIRMSRTVSSSTDKCNLQLPTNINFMNDKVCVDAEWFLFAEGKYNYRLRLIVVHFLRCYHINAKCFFNSVLLNYIVSLPENCIIKLIYAHLIMFFWI